MMFDIMIAWVPAGIMIAWGIGLIGVWGVIANVITSNKRRRLIQLRGHTGCIVYARQEYELVTYNQHFWRVFTFRSARSLYGPLIQGVWNHTINNMNTYDKHWWRCYHEIYLKQNARTKKKTRYYMSSNLFGSPLPFALAQAGINLNEWLNNECKESECKEQDLSPPKFTVGDRVKLKKENPFKGKLKGGEIYSVSHVTYSHIQIGNSMYASEWFKLVGYDDIAANEYDDIIAAQDIMESQ